MLARFVRGHVAALACSLVSALAGADVVSFTAIPNASSANDITPDGRYVVGGTLDGFAYRYDTVLNTTLLLPPECWNAVAVSDDGNTIVGNIIDLKTEDEVAAIWTASSGVWTSLGYLPNALSCPSRSSVYDVSADGTVVIGLSWEGCSGRAFRWTQVTGMVELQNLANGNNRATAIAGNGSVVGGFAQGDTSRTPAFWNSAGAGFLVDPPNGALDGEVFNINETGTQLLGTRDGRAVIWSYPALVPTILGSSLPGWMGISMGIANDGTVVGFDFLTGNRRAWLHRAGPGPCIDLKTYVEANGGIVPTGMLLEVSTGISLDGLTIVGHGMFTGAWMVKIASPCPADIAPAVGNNVIDTDDLLLLLGSWGPCTSALCPADIAPTIPNGVVDTDDLLMLLGSWGSCPPAIGACCTGSSCAQMTQADCLAVAGTYIGNSVPCAVNTCVNNDSCASAINITNKINSGTVHGDNSTATPPIYGGHDPDQPENSPTCQWNQNPFAPHSSVWYSFVAPANGSVTISLCNSISVPLFDTLLALYSGECGALVEKGCDEDSCSIEPAPPYFSRLTANNLTPGQTYRICVMNTGDYNGSQPGPFRLTITSP